MAGRLVLLAWLVCLTSGLVVEDAKDDQKLPVYGYQPGEVTHGIGYGHHLHPFYYRGKRMRYYKCALEDDWKPFESDYKPKDEEKKKNSPPKKFAPTNEKIKPYLINKKVYTKHKLNEKFKSRSDGFRMKHTSMEKDHAQLVREINSMSEKQPFHRNHKILIDKEPVQRPEELVLDDVYFPSIGGDDYLLHGLGADDQPQTQHGPKGAYRKKKFRAVTTKPTVANLIYPPQRINNELKSLAPSFKHSHHPLPFNHHEAVAKSKDTNHFRQGRHAKPPLSMVDKLLFYLPNIL